MSKLNTLTPIAAVLAVSLAGVSHAAENPFAIMSPSAGTTLAAHHDAGKKEEKTTTAADKEGKCGEGKCGGKKEDKPATPAEKTDMTDKAGKEGKCGEGKCGTKTYGVN